MHGNPDCWFQHSKKASPVHSCFTVAPAHSCFKGKKCNFSDSKLKHNNEECVIFPEQKRLNERLNVRFLSRNQPPTIRSPFQSSCTKSRLFRTVARPHVDTKSGGVKTAANFNNSRSQWI